MKLYHKNPRQITEKQFTDLGGSLSRLGDLGGIVHDLNSDEIIGGNQRSRVFDINQCEIELKEQYLEPDEQGTVGLGFVIWRGKKYAYRQVRWTVKQCEEANIRANKNGGSFDFDTLANEFELDDLLEWGFERKELDLDLWASEKPDDPGAQIDKAEELREKWGVESGQLWKLGEHRLICGDCTDRAVVERVISKPFNLIADPPYNIGFNYQNIDDKLPPQDYVKFCDDWFTLCSMDASGVIVTPGPQNERLYPKPRDKGIWLKRNASAGASVFYLRCCEPIYFYGDFKQKRDFDFFDYSSGFTEELRAARCAARVEDEHPPAKPIELWRELIGMFKPGMIFDPFGGNGTTLMSCEGLKLPSITLEIYPPYCSVIIQRWVDMTGGIPELLDVQT